MENKKYCGKTIKVNNQATAYQYRIYCDKLWEQCDECKKKFALEVQNEK